VDFEGVVRQVRSLVGRDVVSALFDADGNQLVVWEGRLSEEEESEGMFLVGAKPFLLDRADIAAAEAIAPAGVRLRGVDGTVVELVPA
jgi:hypothetical protein